MSDEKKCKLNSYGTNPSIDTKDDHSEAPSNVFYPLNHQARRRRRTHFTSAQISELEGIFERIPYPGASIRNTISSNLGIPDSGNLKIESKFGFKIKERGHEEKNGERQTM